MDYLVAADFQLKLTPVTVFGKRAFVKKLTFGQELKLEKLVKNEEKYAKTAVAMALVDKNGKPIFATNDQAIKAFDNLSAQELADLFNEISSSVKKAAKALVKK